MKNKTSEELMLIYKQNSPDEAIGAFNELYARFSQKVYNYLNSRVKNHTLSDDLLQKIFLKVHESKHLFDPKYKFEQWIFVISRSAVLDHFRSEKRYDERLKKFEMPESNEKINLELELNADDLELLEMKYIDELSYGEISKVLDKSETSLRKSVSRLMNKLRKG